MQLLEMIMCVFFCQAKEKLQKIDEQYSHFTAMFANLGNSWKFLKKI